MFFRAILSGFIYSIRALILLKSNVAPEKIKDIAGIKDLRKARALALIILFASVAGVVFAIFLVWYFFYT
jgi:uncharacterized RDD family membrane protein YckC